MEHQVALEVLNLEVLVGVEEEVRPFQEEEEVVVVLQDPLVEVVVEEAFLLAACREVAAEAVAFQNLEAVVEEVAVEELLRDFSSIQLERVALLAKFHLSEVALLID